MQAWARERSVLEATLASDGNCEFTEKTSMAVDKSDVAIGRRSWRFDMLVRDGVTENLFAEAHEPGDSYQVSDADTMLPYVNPQARAPDRVVVFTRDGCPHCAKARELFNDAGLDYAAIPLDDSVRATAIGALTGRNSVPQVLPCRRCCGDRKGVGLSCGRQEHVEGDSRDHATAMRSRVMSRARGRRGRYTTDRARMASARSATALP
jgi:glutaredoxin